MVTLVENETNYAVAAYLIYLPVVMLLTFFVAKTLFKNGKIFMMDIFNGREEIALSTNRLFEVGFYLLNLGFAFWILKMNYLDTTKEMIEALSQKIGGFSIYLGIVLFLNLYMFFRGKRAAKKNKQMQEIQQRMAVRNQG